MSAMIYQHVLFLHYLIQIDIPYFPATNVTDTELQGAWALG